MKFMLCCLLFALTGYTTPNSDDKPKELYTPENEWATVLHDGLFTAKSFSIGAYKTGSRSNGTSAQGLPPSIKHPKDAFYYTISGPNDTLNVQTLNTVHVVFAERDLPSFLDKAAADAAFFFALLRQPSHPEVQWELIMKQPTYLDLNDDKPVGVLTLDKTTYRITAHNHFGIVNSYEKITYEIQERGKPLAAVMPGAQPKVWVSKTVTREQEVLFAGVISALLFR